MSYVWKVKSICRRRHSPGLNVSDATLALAAASSRCGCACRQGGFFRAPLAAPDRCQHRGHLGGLCAACRQHIRDSGRHMPGRSREHGRHKAWLGRAHHSRAAAVIELLYCRHLSHTRRAQELYNGARRPHGEGIGIAWKCIACMHAPSHVGALCKSLGGGRGPLALGLHVAVTTAVITGAHIHRGPHRLCGCLALLARVCCR
mmetsp:Transcript_29870/g.76048  ORF Transcript_29870/g.76048 Transcript_29870/m.76048 type:complete len:203 (+) Transcript_29870:520-1128(+)